GWCAREVEHEPATRDVHLALGPEPESAHDDALERLLGEGGGDVQHAFAGDLVADLARRNGHDIEVRLTASTVAPAERHEHEGDDDHREDHEGGDQPLIHGRPPPA